MRRSVSCWRESNQWTVGMRAVSVYEDSSALSPNFDLAGRECPVAHPQKRADNTVLYHSRFPNRYRWRQPLNHDTYQSSFAVLCIRHRIRQVVGRHKIVTMRRIRFLRHIDGGIGRPFRNGSHGIVVPKNPNPIVPHSGYLNGRVTHRRWLAPVNFHRHRVRNRQRLVVKVRSNFA